MESVCNLSLRSKDFPSGFACCQPASRTWQAWRTMPLALPAGARIAADAAYTFYEREDAFVESDEISLLVGRKRNSERRDAHAMRDYKQWFRRRIETVFGEITKLFSQKIHAMTLSDFILKISLVLFAYQVDKSFIH